jgi:hypothetical protein
MMAIQHVGDGACSNRRETQAADYPWPFALDDEYNGELAKDPRPQHNGRNGEWGRYNEKRIQRSPARFPKCLGRSI